MWPLSSRRGGGKALVAVPLKKNFYFFAALRIKVDFFNNKNVKDYLFLFDVQYICAMHL